MAFIYQIRQCHLSRYDTCMARKESLSLNRRPSSSLSLYLNLERVAILQVRKQADILNTDVIFWQACASS
jgi:hypothetical protein